MRRLVLVSALCLLVVLAGCSIGGESTPAGPDGLTAENAPAGVTADGELTDPTALLDAHTASLESSGFVLRLRSNATVSRNGELRQIRRQQIVRAEPGVAEYNTTVVNPGSRFDTWGNQSVRAARIQVGDKTRYRTGEPRSAAALSGQKLIARYLTTDDWRVTDVEQRDGETLFTLRSSTVPTTDGVVPSGAENVRNYNAVLVVDGEGRIRFFKAAGEYTIEGNKGSFAVRQEVVSLSGPDITRPGWLSDAFAAG